MRLYELNNQNTIYFTFITSNPPSLGYKLILDKLKTLSKNHEHIIFINPSQDNQIMPLDFKETLKFNKAIFKGFNFYERDNIQNAIQAVKYLSKDYTNIVFLTKDENLTGLHRIYDYASTWGVTNFDMIGLGDSKSTLPNNMHRQDAISFARDNDYDMFVKVIPTNNEHILSELFLTLRKKMDIDDEVDSTKVDESYQRLIKFISEKNHIIKETYERDELRNRVIPLSQAGKLFSKLRLVLSPGHKGISLGEDKNNHPVIIFNTTPDNLNEYLDINESAIKNVLRKYHELIENTSGGIASTATSLFKNPIKRTSAPKGTKLPKSKEKSLTNAINEYTKKHGMLTPEILDKLRKKYQ